MSEIRIHNSILSHEGHQLHGQKVNLTIIDGIIAELRPAEGTGTFSGAPSPSDWVTDNGYISAGWVDTRAEMGEPGHEEDETLLTGARAAMAGGFTHVALMPENAPRTVTPGDLSYILNRSADFPVAVLPLAAATTQKDNDSMTEMLELANAGAAGFTTGYGPPVSLALLMKVLDYASQRNMPVMVPAEDRGLAGKNLINEGEISVMLGMKGSPEVGEHIAVESYCRLALMLSRPIHLSMLSTAESLNIVRNYLAKGAEITADVSIHHLSYTDTDLLDFDTRLKLRPPLRRAADRDALRAALLAEDWLRVVSDHRPKRQDVKVCEYELAAHGSLGLQTMFSQLIEIYGVNNIDAILHILGTRNRRTLRLPLPAMEEGSPADITWCDPSHEWLFDAATNKSRSINSVRFNTVQQGRAGGIVRGKLSWHHENAIAGNTIHSK